MLVYVPGPCSIILYPAMLSQIVGTFLFLHWLLHLSDSDCIVKSTGLKANLSLLQWNKELLSDENQNIVSHHFESDLHLKRQVLMLRLLYEVVSFQCLGYLPELEMPLVLFRTNLIKW